MGASICSPLLPGLTEYSPAQLRLRSISTVLNQHGRCTAKTLVEGPSTRQTGRRTDPSSSTKGAQRRSRIHLQLLHLVGKSTAHVQLKFFISALCLAGQLSLCLLGLSCRCSWISIPYISITCYGDGRCDSMPAYRSAANSKCRDPCI